MIFGGVIPSMYVGSLQVLTPGRLRAHYNASMDFLLSPRERLTNLPPRQIDGVVAVGLTFFIQAQGLGALGGDVSFGSPVGALTALMMTAPLAWRKRFPLVVFGLVVLGLEPTFTGDVIAHTGLV
jgi:hypothetical protein